MLHFAYRKIQQKWETFPFVKASPGAGIARFVTHPQGVSSRIVAYRLKFQINAFDIAFPPGGKVSPNGDE